MIHTIDTAKAAMAAYDEQRYETYHAHETDACWNVMGECMDFVRTSYQEACDDYFLSIDDWLIIDEDEAEDAERRMEFFESYF